jgi:tripartite-type tricarboxylate transporter receptor subunit TctC
MNLTRMNLTRRTFVQFTGAAAAAPGLSGIARAQTYPARPITLIVPYPPGGPTDVLARILAEQMRRSLGKPMIIENVAGAEGTIGVSRAARAKADGYTIDLGAMSTHVLNAALYSLPYDVLNDFAPILPLATTPQVLFARDTIPAKSLKEFIAWLKANPKAASVGIGASVSQVAAALFQKETSTQLTKVPYRTANVAMQDLTAGQIDLVFTTPDRLALVAAGGAKALAVTSDTRLTLYPDLPTFVENGLPALSLSFWFALYAPAATPSFIIDKLQGAAMDALADPTARYRLAQLGMEIFPREQQTPAALDSLQRADSAKWWPIIKALNIKRD